MIQTLDLRGIQPTRAQLLSLIPRPVVDISVASDDAKRLIGEVRVVVTPSDRTDDVFFGIGPEADVSAFQDRTIEMQAPSEEAVVGKEARVVEEIGVRKEATERVETVRDTVRHTEVEVEDTRTQASPTTGTSTTGTSGAGTSGSGMSGSGTMGTGGNTSTATTGATSSGTNAPRK